MYTPIHVYPRKGNPNKINLHIPAGTLRMLFTGVSIESNLALPGVVV